VAQFGAAGVMLISAKARAFVPLREIFKLAEGSDKRFRAPDRKGPRGPNAALFRMAAKVKRARVFRRSSKVLKAKG